MARSLSRQALLASSVALTISLFGPAAAQAQEAQSPFDDLSPTEAEQLSAALEAADCDPAQLERLRNASIQGIERVYDQTRLEDPGEVLEYACIGGLLNYKWGGFINIPNIADELGELIAGACNQFRRHIANTLDANLRVGFEVPGFRHSGGYFDGLRVGGTAGTAPNRGRAPNPAVVLGDKRLDQMGGSYRTSGTGSVTPQSMRRQPAGSGAAPTSSFFEGLYPSQPEPKKDN